MANDHNGCSRIFADWEGGNWCLLLPAPSSLGGTSTTAHATTDTEKNGERELTMTKPSEAKEDKVKNMGEPILATKHDAGKKERRGTEKEQEEEVMHGIHPRTGTGSNHNNNNVSTTVMKKKQKDTIENNTINDEDVHVAKKQQDDDDDDQKQKKKKKQTKEQRQQQGGGGSKRIAKRQEHHDDDRDAKKRKKKKKHNTTFRTTPTGVASTIAAMFGTVKDDDDINCTEAAAPVPLPAQQQHQQEQQQSELSLDDYIKTTHNKDQGVISPNDVLQMKGAAAQQTQHPGNIYFYSLCEEHFQEWYKYDKLVDQYGKKATYMENKNRVCVQIVRKFYAQPGGGIFRGFNLQPMPKQKVMEKVRARLRQIKKPKVVLPSFVGTNDVVFCSGATNHLFIGNAKLRSLLDDYEERYWPELFPNSPHSAELIEAMKKIKPNKNGQRRYKPNYQFRITDEVIDIITKERGGIFREKYNLQEISVDPSTDEGSKGRRMVNQKIHERFRDIKRRIEGKDWRQTKKNKTAPNITLTTANSSSSCDDVVETNDKVMMSSIEGTTTTKCNNSRNNRNEDSNSSDKIGEKNLIDTSSTPIAASTGGTIISSTVSTTTNDIASSKASSTTTSAAAAATTTTNTTATTTTKITNDVPIVSVTNQQRTDDNIDVDVANKKGGNVVAAAAATASRSLKGEEQQQQQQQQQQQHYLVKKKYIVKRTGISSTHSTIMFGQHRGGNGGGSNTIDKKECTTRRKRNYYSDDDNDNDNEDQQWYYDDDDIYVRGEADDSESMEQEQQRKEEQAKKLSQSRRERRNRREEQQKKQKAMTPEELLQFQKTLRPRHHRVLPRKKNSTGTNSTTNDSNKPLYMPSEAELNTMSEYEKLRYLKMKRNQERLLSLGLK